MDTERSPGSKKTPSASNQASGGSKLISSLDNLVTYLVLGALVVAINVALIICVVNLVGILNTPVRDPDTPLPVTFENTTQPDVANKVITSTTTTAAATNPANLLAEEVKKYMNLSVSPCDDFYSFACGGWHDLKEVQDSTVEISTISLMREKTRKQLIDLLRKTPREEDPHYKTEPRKCFAACNNKEHLQERGTKPFFEFLNSIGKFPILDPTWDPEKSFSLPKALVTLSLLNIPTLFIITRTAYDERFRMSHPDFQLPLRGDEEWMKYILQLLEVDTNSASIKKDLDDMFQFEKTLYTLSKERSYPRTTLKMGEIQGSMPAWFAVVDFFKLLAAGNLTELKDIDDNSIVDCDTQPYVLNIGKLFLESWDGLNKATDQPLSPMRNRRAADNYILKILLSLTSWVDPKFKSLKEFNYPQTNNRETTCVDHVMKLFPTQVLKMYVDEVYQSQSDTYINALAADMKKTLQLRINESDWVEKDIEGYVSRSVGNRKVYAGYLKVEPDEALNNLYKMGPTDEFFEYSLETLKHEFNKSLFPAKDSWYSLLISFSADAGSYRLDPEDFIVVQAPFLQPPVMSLTWPRSMNYGAIGTFLSHEMNLGWSEARHFAQYYRDLPMFENKRECFKAKYDKYLFQGSKINGQQTVLRNVFDNEGIKTSFMAYQNVKSKGTEPQVNGLNFTHNQLFFVAYAQMMCQKIPKSLTEAALSRNFPPNKIRVLGNLMNFNGFADSFKCKPGASMNPTSKCRFI